MQSAAQSQMLTGFLWLAGIVVVAVVASAVVVAVRRRFRDFLPDRRPSFTLEELRRLRDGGRLRPDEFEAIAGRLTGRTDVAEENGARERAR